MCLWLLRELGIFYNQAKLAYWLERMTSSIWLSWVKHQFGKTWTRQGFPIIPGKIAMIKRLDTRVCVRAHTVFHSAQRAVHVHRLQFCTQRKYSRHLNISKPNKTSWRILFLWSDYLFLSVFWNIKRSAEIGRVALDRNTKEDWKK